MLCPRPAGRRLVRTHRTSRGAARSSPATPAPQRHADSRPSHSHAGPARLSSATVVSSDAAGADFRPAAPVADKISKSGRDGLTVELEPTPDVLAELAEERRAGQIVVGFAAEHGKGAAERGRRKLERKRLDAVVVNDISRA